MDFQVNSQIYHVPVGINRYHISLLSTLYENALTALDMYKFSFSASDKKDCNHVSTPSGPLFWPLRVKKNTLRVKKNTSRVKKNTT